MYDGTYRGLIIQNNDPKKEGRVKVYVPGINIKQLSNWNQKKEEDKLFTVLGQNTQTAITKDILQNQKEKLFWAEVMMPLVGASSPGTYHAPSDTFYIGNDSDYTFQESNKSNIMFEQDRSTQESRENTTIQFTNEYSSPRTNIILDFKITGQKYCVTSNCNDSGSFPAFWKNSYNNECLDNIKNTLTPVYSSTPISAISPITTPQIINTSISDIQIDVLNPSIFVDDVYILPSNPVYNNSCVEPIPLSGIGFTPPVSYERSEAPPQSGTIANLSISILINGKDTLQKKFRLTSSNTEELTYTSDLVKVVIPKKNIKNIKVKNKDDNFDLSKILSLLPIIKSISSIIMPPAPYNQGQTVYSRGGGGGEIYNNITTNLLTSSQRQNMHVGGANNESRYSINYGRESLNNPNNTKGVNIQSNRLQLHRGPMRAPDYNNDWKGILSIPGVGAHVWVRFENGDPHYPIIIGTFAAQADYKGIYEMQ